MLAYYNSELPNSSIYMRRSVRSVEMNAVIDEIIRGWVVDRWLAPLEVSDDPISAAFLPSGGCPSTAQEYKTDVWICLPLEYR